MPTVDTVEEATAGRDWTFFPPLGKRSLGGGQAFSQEFWGNVPGGYRNTANDNIVLIEEMIETLDGAKNAFQDRQGSGHYGRLRRLSGDLGNFLGIRARPRPIMSG